MPSVREKDLKAAARAARDVLGGHNLVLVGLMGAGKSVIGRLLSEQIGLPFIDTDDEIVAAAQMPITEIFAHYGEPEFRSLEQRVVRRVLQAGPQVVSTGGGAFINAETRQYILDHSLSLWLRADFDVLWHRVSKRTTRPLLQQPNPKKVLRDLMDERYPIYGQADLVVQSRNVPKHDVVFDVARTIGESADIVNRKMKRRDNDAIS